MVSIYDVPTNELIEEAAKELQKMPELRAPEWADYVKTGVHRQRLPLRRDWWYVRAAAVIRSVYKLGPIGVSKLRKRYGGRKNRGVAPDKTYKSSGNILRKILQQLELVEFVKQAEKGVHKGRIITPKGKSFLDKIAAKVYTPQAKAKKVQAKKEQEVPKKAVEEKKQAEKEDKNKVSIDKQDSPKPEAKKEQPEKPKKQKVKKESKKPEK